MLLTARPFDRALPRLRSHRRAYGTPPPKQREDMTGSLRHPRPRRIAPGLVLVIALAALGVTASPASAEPHVVKRGETLGGIARRYACKLGELKAANDLRGDAIRAGQELVIPPSCGNAPAADAPPDTAKPSSKSAAPKKKTLTHEVLPGESVEEIALRYGMPLDALQAKNKRVLAKGLKPGLRLKVETLKDERAQRKITYTIEAGDTLGGIAKRFGVSLKDLQRMNPGKKPERLRIGDRLVIYGEGKPTRSQAVGLPQRGRLVDGEQFKDVAGTFLRRPHLTWGTNETVRAMKAAIAEVRKKHPKVHDLVIGDFSRKEGGFLPPHKSHQSGLDVDLGFYFKGQPKHGPKAFLDATRVALDLEATWTLVTALVGPSEAASNIEYMFIGYPVQKKLYDYARGKGVSEAKLDWLFQYPRGSRAMRGIIRHEPGHTNHIHLRYKCPSGDVACL